MPITDTTTSTDALHRLAALIAVEREAADRYRRGVDGRRNALMIYGVNSSEYRAASREEDDAMRVMIQAQIATDAALREVAS